MANPTTWVDRARVEARLSREVVRQLYDDNNDGEADDDPVDQLIEDAHAWATSWLDPTYGDDLPLPYTPEVRRLTLDAVEWMAAKRHPEYVRRDWEKLKADNRKDFESLRTQLRTLGQRPPDPSKTVGGAVLVTDPVLFSSDGGDF